MGKRPRVVQGSFAAGRPIVAILIAVAIFIAGQATLARAAPAVLPPRTTIGREYRLFAAPSGRTSLCIGQTAHFYVSVSEVVTRRTGSLTYEVSTAQGGEEITTAVGSPNIGTLSPSTAVTRFQGGSAQVDFTFKGTSRGLTTITFSHAALAPLGGASSIDPASDVVVQVQVRKCRFRVRTHGRWLLPDGFRPSMVASMDNAEMTSDANGVYSGRGSVSSFARPTLFVGCNVVMSVSPSVATLSGQFDNNGGLEMDIGYETVTAQTQVTCIIPRGGNDGPATPDPILLTMPASGGVATRSQVLAAYIPVTGRATIVLTPIYEETSFNDDSFQARGSPSALWAAMPWGGALWFPGALIMRAGPG